MLATGLLVLAAAFASSSLANGGDLREETFIIEGLHNGDWHYNVFVENAHSQTINSWHEFRSRERLGWPTLAYGDKTGLCLCGLTASQRIQIVSMKNTVTEVPNLSAYHLSAGPPGWLIALSNAAGTQEVHLVQVVSGGTAAPVVDLGIRLPGFDARYDSIERISYLGLDPDSRLETYAMTANRRSSLVLYVFTRDPSNQTTLLGRPLSLPFHLTDFSVVGNRVLVVTESTVSRSETSREIRNVDLLSGNVQYEIRTRETNSLPPTHIIDFDGDHEFSLRIGTELRQYKYDGGNQPPLARAEERYTVQAIAQKTDPHASVQFALPAHLYLGVYTEPRNLKRVKEWELRPPARPLRPFPARAPRDLDAVSSAAPAPSGPSEADLQEVGSELNRLNEVARYIGTSPLGPKPLTAATLVTQDQVRRFVSSMGDAAPEVQAKLRAWLEEAARAPRLLQEAKTIGLQLDPHGTPQALDAQGPIELRSLIAILAAAKRSLCLGTLTKKVVPTLD